MLDATSCTTVIFTPPASCSAHCRVLLWCLPLLHCDCQARLSLWFTKKRGVLGGRKRVGTSTDVSLAPPTDTEKAEDLSPEMPRQTPTVLLHAFLFVIRSFSLSWRLNYSLVFSASWLSPHIFLFSFFFVFLVYLSPLLLLMSDLVSCAQFWQIRHSIHFLSSTFRGAVNVCTPRTYPLSLAHFVITKPIWLGLGQVGQRCVRRWRLVRGFMMKQGCGHLLLLLLIFGIQL